VNIEYAGVQALESSEHAHRYGDELGTHLKEVVAEAEHHRHRNCSEIVDDKDG
jgi:hypothetical protein